MSKQFGCGSDLIRLEITGFVYPMGNVKRLAEIMTKMTSQPKRIIRMGKNSLRHIEVYSTLLALAIATNQLEPRHDH